ncbi:MAG: glutathione peroxidase [Bacteroidales bacterium]|nr:glutathione peroxidase [Bacteroidales bacterium]
MKRIITLLVLAAAMMGSSTLALAQNEAAVGKNVYQFCVKGENGQNVPLEKYAGKTLLIVNTATKCGFTPQYEELESLYQDYKDKGFVILDFPCNQFGEQAPGSYEEIHAFCTGKYNISFPQFEKIDVNGENADPLFTWLKSQKGFQGFNTKDRIGKFLDNRFRKQDPNYDQYPDIKWNFTKFLVDKDGNVVERFEPTATAADIEVKLKELLD